MKRLATAFLALGALAVASTAFAVDLNVKGELPQGGESVLSLTTIFSCDNNTPSSAYFQDDLARYGNKFSFGAASRLSRVEFAHFGFGFAGPYNYDIEMWDATSCTPITAVNGLIAQDAAGAPALESVGLCLQNINLTGDVIVAIDANSCAIPTDCYPDVLFDTQANVVCPYVVDATSLQCFDVSAQSGPFLLRVEVDNCPVKVQPASWGVLKQIYR